MADDYEWVTCQRGGIRSRCRCSADHTRRRVRRQATLQLSGRARSRIGRGATGSSQRLRIHRSHSPVRERRRDWPSAMQARGPEQVESSFTTNTK
jgi:hypothetical protein